MTLVLLGVSFVLGFAVCLMTLGHNENKQEDLIKRLEEENHSLKTIYLSNCWNAPGSPDHNG